MMKTYKRKAIFERLKDYCSFAEKDHYVEVTEWVNGEGFDVDVHSKLPTRFQLTYGEWDLIVKLVEYLNEQDIDPESDSINPKFSN
jgi:hypothetical protein